MFSFLILIVNLLIIRYSNGFTVERINELGESKNLFKLPIIHMNDFHARFVQTNPTSGSCRKGEESQCIGGLARVVTATKQILKREPNSIFLNAGDNYQGTIWYNIHKWNGTVHFMNKLPHDAMTIGNHEFDDGVSGLVPFLQHFNAPVVVCNIDASEEPTIQGLYKNSTIITRENHSIGIIGVIERGTDLISSGTGKLRFLDEVDSVNAEAEKLKDQGVNIIIVLSHCGQEIDRKIASKCPDVDVIVGGHSHTLFYNGVPPSPAERNVGNYPLVVKQTLTGRTVLVVQAASYTKYLGNLTVWFDSEGEVVDWAGNPIYLGSSIVQDPEMLEELKPWDDAVKSFSESVIGETKTTLAGDCFEGECTIGNLITDAMVHAYTNKTDNPKHWTYAAIGCTNPGGIRGKITAGKITRGDIVSVQPFEGTFDVVEMKGEDLLRELEYVVTKSYDDDVFRGKHFILCSGIRIAYNVSNPAWSRVIDVRVRCQGCEEPKYEELRKDEIYRVIVNSFLLNRPDDSILRKKSKNRQTGPKEVDAVVNYIEAISPVDYKLDQRIQIFGEWRG